MVFDFLCYDYVVCCCFMYCNMFCHWMWLVILVFDCDFDDLDVWFVVYVVLKLRCVVVW